MKKTVLFIMALLLSGVLSSNAAVVEKNNPVTFTLSGPTLTTGEYAIHLSFDEQYNYYNMSPTSFSREDYTKFRIEYENMSGPIQVKIQSQTQSTSVPNWHGQYIDLNASETSYTGTFTVGDGLLDDDPVISVFHLVAGGVASITVKKVVLIDPDNHEVELTDGTDGWNSHPSYYKGSFSIASQWQGFALPVPASFNERDQITYNFVFGEATPCAFNIEATYDDAVHYIEIPLGTTEFAYSVSKRLTKLEIKDKTEGLYPHVVKISSIKRTIISNTVLNTNTIFNTETLFDGWEDNIDLGANPNAKVGDIIKVNFKETVTDQNFKFSDKTNGWSEVAAEYAIYGSVTGSNLEFVLNKTFVDLYHAGQIAIQGCVFTISSIELMTTDNSVMPITIGSTGWATFNDANCAYNFEGTGVTAYIVKGATGTAITKEAVTNPAANTGLLITGAPGPYSIPVAASGTDYSSTNQMVGGSGTEITSSTGNGYNYVLAENTGGEAEFQKIESTSATIPVGKAYLALSSAPAGARIFSLDDTNTTAIKDVKVGAETNIYYDLQGRRILNPKHGLYIINGKKIILK